MKIIPLPSAETYRTSAGFADRGRLTAESRLQPPLESSPTRVLVVDDHPMFRRGLIHVMTQEGDMIACGEAQNAGQALNLLRGNKPDLVVVDISLPGVNGIELIKQMSAEQRKVAFLAISMHNESYFALRAFRAGARGYVMKCESADEIIAAIRKVRDGGFYVSPALRERLIFKAIQSLEEGAGTLVDTLTDRELEIFRFLGKGLGTREIAEQLELSTKTVETHRGHMKERLGCKNSSEVVQFAIDWITREDC